MKKKSFFIVLAIAFAVIVGINAKTAEAGFAVPEKYVDEQGLSYYYNEKTDEVSVEEFEQKYDVSGKPMYTKIVIPDVVYFKKVTKICDVFKGHKEITSVQIGDNVEKLENTFQGCSGLEKIDLANVQEIGESAFQDCTGLKEVNAKMVRKILDKAFLNCTKLQKITLSSAFSDVYEKAFYNCKSLRSVYLPKNGLSTDAFKNCTMLEKADFYVKPKDYIVDTDFFKNTKIEKKFKKAKKPIVVKGVLLDASTAGDTITIDGKKISCVAQDAFKSKKKLTSVFIKNVKKIYSNMFYGCNAKNVTIANAKYIEKDIFDEFNNLKKLTIQGNVSITKTMIKYMKNPKKVTLYVDANRVNTLQKKLGCKVRPISKKKIAKGAVYQNVSYDGKEAIEDEQGIVYQYVKKFNYEYYHIVGFNQKYDGAGNAIHTQLVIPDKVNGYDVSGMADNVFRNQKNLVSVNFASNYKIYGISKEAFSGCSNLKTVVLPSELISIGKKAFKDCTSLSEINFPEKLESIFEGAFQNDILLQNVKLPYKIKLLSNSCFQNCTGIKNVNLPGSVEMICSKAFYQCSALEKVIFESTPDSLKASADAFEGTKWLSEFAKKNKPAVADGVLLCGTIVSGKVVIKGKDVKCIAGYSFAKGKKMTELQIDGVASVGENAFAGNALKKATIHNVKKMDVEIFRNTKKLTSLSVDGVNKIGYKTFVSMHGLKKVTLGKDVSVIGLKAFANCEQLSSVIFKTTKKIEWEKRISKMHFDEETPKTFYGCKKLRHVYMKSKKVSATMKDVFGMKVTVHVPKKYKAAYRKNSYCKVVAAK